MDSSWKSLQIRMEAAWNMRTTPKTKRPKTGDIISSAHSLDWNKKKVRQLQQAWNDEVAKLVADRNEAISDVMVDILALIQKCFLLIRQAIISGWSSFALGFLIPRRFAKWWSHTRILIPTVLNASRLPEPQTAYMSSMPTVSSIEKIPQSAMSSVC